MKPPKETRRVEGRGRPEEGSPHRTQDRTQGRNTLPSKLWRVHEAAKKDKRTRFTALLHHVTVEALERAFRRLRRGATAGVDGETVASYEQGLREKLEDLHERVHQGRYRPQPVRRVYIPKSDGGLRPLGIPVLEDKIVQSAVAEVLSAIYEADFIGFSYGFRPGRSPHKALAAVHTALMTRNVNWVLDADIRSFFDSVDHEWMMRLVEHRIADPRVLRLIRGWLKAGVLDGTEWKESEQGTPQGAGISPLLANIFLHYVLDLWVRKWRETPGRGQIFFVRYADDFVMGFAKGADAEQMRADLGERLAKFKLALHEDKTRLIEFGGLVAAGRKRRAERRPKTFAFLGFTHYCAWSREGRFVVKRRTDQRRITRKLNQVRVQMWQRMHRPIAEQHRWLSRVLRGHDAYYGLSGNWHRLNGFHKVVQCHWYRVLAQRSQLSMPWSRFNALLARFPLPQAQLIPLRKVLGA